MRGAIFLQTDDWKAEILSSTAATEITWNTERYPNDEICTRLQLEATDRFEQIDVWVRFGVGESIETQWVRLLLILEAAGRYTDELRVNLPYMPYSLQDREFVPGYGVSSRVFARTLESVGVQKISLIDLHNPASISAWSIPVEHLRPERLLADAVQSELVDESLAIIAPDKGALVKANLFGEYLHAPVFTLQKERFGPGEVRITAQSLADCPAGHLLIVDDIINTGGTLVAAIEAIRETCAAKVSVVATHGLFMHSADQRLLTAGAEKIFVTDSFVSGVENPGIKVVRIWPLFLEQK